MISDPDFQPGNPTRIFYSDFRPGEPFGQDYFVPESLLAEIILSPRAFWPRLFCPRDYYVPESVLACREHFKAPKLGTLKLSVISKFNEILVSLVNSMKF
jgi:hypothetical protein